MSTCAEVQAAWETAIFNHATIQAISEQAHGFEVTADSETEMSDLMFRDEVNAFEYLVTRSQSLGVTHSVDYEFNVEIRYYRQSDPAGENWQAVRDAFDTIFSLVQSSLTTTWGGTVDYYEPQEGPPEITQIRIEELAVWRGVFRYVGTQTVTV